MALRRLVLYPFLVALAGWYHELLNPMEKILSMTFKNDTWNVSHILMRTRAKQKQAALKVWATVVIGCFFLFSACSSLKSDEEQADAFFNSGMTEMASNHFKSAIIEFKNAIQINPKLAKAHFQLGLAYVSSHQLLSGFIQMRTAVRLDPQNDAYLDTFANLLFEHHYYSDAAKYFEEMVERKQEKGLLFLLGTGSLKAKHFEKAVVTFKRILDGDPDNVSARIGLADALYNLNEINEAQKTLEETASTAKDNIEAQIALTGFYEKRKQYVLAKEKLQQIARRYSQGGIALAWDSILAHSEQNGLLQYW
jgi:Tfp pilus assembly protein PilF